MTRTGKVLMLISSGVPGLTTYDELPEYPSFADTGQTPKDPPDDLLLKNASGFSGESQNIRYSPIGSDRVHGSIHGIWT